VNITDEVNITCPQGQTPLSVNAPLGAFTLKGGFICFYLTEERCPLRSFRLIGQIFHHIPDTAGEHRTKLINGFCYGGIIFFIKRNSPYIRKENLSKKAVRASESIGFPIAG